MVSSLNTFLFFLRYQLSTGNQGKSGRTGKERSKQDGNSEGIACRLLFDSGLDKRYKYLAQASSLPANSKKKSEKNGGIPSMQTGLTIPGTTSIIWINME